MTALARRAHGRKQPASAAAIDEAIDKIRRHRIGGSYWGPHPPLPRTPFTLLRIRDAADRASMIGSLSPGATFVCWVDSAATAQPLGDDAAVALAGPCDPWHLLDGASAVIAHADDELALLAAIAGKPLRCIGSGRFGVLASDPSTATLRRAVQECAIDSWDYFDPFTGEPITFAQAADYCGFWRAQIDRNRDIRGAIGFAYWKRRTAAPLLWGGSDVRFLSGATAARAGERVAIWKSRTSPATVTELERRGVALVEVEDGFIRSAGLGADCIPPLSIVVDPIGVHFDPSRPSELEELLEEGGFSREVLARAVELRRMILASGLTKYASGQERLERRDVAKRHILVPGQVEDDRAVLSGGSGLTSNLELLRRVRADAPDAYILYKPHPDVEAGHRSGAIPHQASLALADEIVADQPMSALLDLVDEVHVNSSLAGFEALLRGKSVTTHGVPFYAGWGLTRDLGAVPDRRRATRTLDELVAAVLLIYPRYLDPTTGLPCPPEILVRRLAESSGRQAAGLLVQLRRLQGRCRRRLNALRYWR